MSDSQDVASQVADASNILFLAPAFHPDRQDTCVDLLTPQDPGRTHVVGVTYAKSAEGWIRNYRKHGEDPGRLTVISVGEQTRSTTATAPMSGPVIPGVPRVETVSSPTDLTELGIRLSAVLKEHEIERWNDHDEIVDMVLCYDSLSSLLQFVDERRAFRFLHVMTNRLTQGGVTAHYHLDPSAHDQKVVATLKTLFNTVVEVDDDGEWTVRNR